MRSMGNWVFEATTLWRDSVSIKQFPQITYNNLDWIFIIRTFTRADNGEVNILQYDLLH